MYIFNIMNFTQYIIKPYEFDNIDNITPIKLLLNDLSKEAWTWISINSNEEKIVNNIVSLMNEILSEINYLVKNNSKITIKLNGLCNFFFLELDNFRNSKEIHKKINYIINKQLYSKYFYLLDIIKKYIKIEKEKELNLLEFVIDNYFRL